MFKLLDGIHDHANGAFPILSLLAYLFTVSMILHSQACNLLYDLKNHDYGGQLLDALWVLNMNLHILINVLVNTLTWLF